MADVSVTPANVALVSGTQQVGTAGATITAGQTLYLKAADSELYLADADDTSATATCVGIALNGASNGQPIAYAGSGAVVINMGGTLVIGTVYVLSDTPGGVKPTTDLATGDYTGILGIGITAANLKCQIVLGGVAVPA